jgi:hypothetical protein
MESDGIMLSPRASALLALLQFLTGMGGSLLIVLMTPFIQAGRQALLFVLIYGTIVCPLVWFFGQYIQRLIAPASAPTLTMARSQLLGGVLLVSLFGLTVLVSSRSIAGASLVGMIAGILMAIQGERLRQRLHTGLSD